MYLIIEWLSAGFGSIIIYYLLRPSLTSRKGIDSFDLLFNAVMLMVGPIGFIASCLAGLIWTIACFAKR